MKDLRQEIWEHLRDLERSDEVETARSAHQIAAALDISSNCARTHLLALLKEKTISVVSCQYRQGFKPVNLYWVGVRRTMRVPRYYAPPKPVLPVVKAMKAPVYPVTAPVNRLADWLISPRVSL